MVKKFFKNIKAKCKGFSLMELVVTIAIMAVLAAVLAPALIHYVEDSRAAKDDHAMSEVVNAVKVAIAYDDVYDEIIDDITWKNSCYVDSDSPKAENIEYLFVDDNEKAYKSYIYKDAERELDETPYKFAGRMYGATVTFRPNNENVIEIKDGVYSGNDVQGKKISEMSEENILYTKIKQVIGNKIELTSATYKNSQYTIFICFGVEAEKSQGEHKVELSDEPMVIYGQWSGTNLLTIEMQDPALDDTPDFDYGKHDGIIPEGGQLDSINPFADSSYCPICGYNFADPWCWCQCFQLSAGIDTCESCAFDFNSQEDLNSVSCWCGSYTVKDYNEMKDIPSESLGAGDAFPSVDKSNIYTYGDYTYIYCGSYNDMAYYAPLDYQFYCNNSLNGWLVCVRDETAPADHEDGCGTVYYKFKDVYEMPLTSIGGKPVVSMSYFFYGHDSRTIKEINLPSSLTKIDESIFYGCCRGLLNVEKINYGGTKAQWAKLTENANYFSSYINTNLTNVVHCKDGDVCIQHTAEANSNSDFQKYNSSYHTIDGTCSVCGVAVKIKKSHNYGDYTYQNYNNASYHYKIRTCNDCGYESKSSTSHTFSSTYTYEQYDNNYNHYKIQTCSTCGYQKKTTASHTYSSNTYESDGDENTHLLVRTCTACSQTTRMRQSHTIEGECTDDFGNCEYCGQLGRPQNHYSYEYRYEKISDSEHRSIEYCPACNYIFSEYDESHWLDYDGGTTNDWKTCAETSHATCGACGFISNENSSVGRHIQQTASCSSPLTCCGTVISSTKATGIHHFVNGACKDCGNTSNKISFSQSDVYINYNHYVDIGSWSFDGATSVNITVSGYVEDGHDWIAFTPGTTYKAGDPVTRQYYNTATNSVDSDVTIPVGYSPSAYKVTGNISKTFTNVPMTSGTIILFTDYSVLQNGYTITITPNY